MESTARQAVVVVGFRHTLSHRTNGTHAASFVLLGGLGWKNNIPVVPGTNYTVFVGIGGTSAAYGSSNGTAGQQSYFIDNTTVAGFGGAPGIGGSFIPANQGGKGGDTFIVLATQSSSSGGGGAGGYTGQGGKGGHAPSNPATAGSGGAGGGGFGSEGGSIFQSGSGGGVLLGGNANATDGTAGNADSTGAGGGGSWGCGGLYTYQYCGEIPPNGAGGGANQPGGPGACRVVWGTGTSWPGSVPTLEGCVVPDPPSR
jgi:hypothetical protein